MTKAVVVYTALFGGYDTLQEPGFPSECDFVCFTDDASLTSRRWNITRVEPSMDPAMMNRHIKIHPHKYLSEYPVSIYVDANLEMRRDPGDLVRAYLVDTIFAAPRHPKRNCVYQEIQQCVSTGKIDPVAGRAQADRYRAEGYPQRNGLTENRVLVRRHNDPAVKSLMEAWWAELLSGVPRDQISLPVVCWRQGFTIRHIAESTVYGSHFLYRPHRQERFTVRMKIHTLILLMRLRRRVHRNDEDLMVKHLV
jgi:hypothetical protein